uniref:Phage tail assembly protein n=1 Tax=Serratia proteamaculans (strain 568) TaxID=399741 RepID=A8GLL4_SERP5
MEIVFKKPFKFEGNEYNKLDIDLDAMTGKDITDELNILSNTGHISASAPLDVTFQAHLAARAAKQPVELIMALPAPEFMHICQRVQNFLLS